MAVPSHKFSTVGAKYSFYLLDGLSEVLKLISNKSVKLLKYLMPTYMFSWIKETEESIDRAILTYLSHKLVLSNYKMLMCFVKCAGCCARYTGEANRHFQTLIHKHLQSNKNISYLETPDHPFHLFYKTLPSVLHFTITLSSAPRL